MKANFALFKDINFKIKLFLIKWNKNDRKYIFFLKINNGLYLFIFRYEENNLKVGRKKTNLMFIGDGKGKTIITGGKSVFNNLTTFHTASFGKY